MHGTMQIKLKILNLQFYEAFGYRLCLNNAAKHAEPLTLLWRKIPSFSLITEEPV